MWDEWDGNPTNDCSHCRSGEDVDDDCNEIGGECDDAGEFGASGVSEPAEPSPLRPVEGSQPAIREFDLFKMTTIVMLKTMVAMMMTASRANCTSEVDFQINSTDFKKLNLPLPQERKTLSLHCQRRFPTKMHPIGMNKYTDEVSGGNSSFIGGESASGNGGSS